MINHSTAGFTSVLAQIVAMDIIFSIDSVITAIGMVTQGDQLLPADQRAMWIPLTIMVTAIVIAIIVMIVFAEPLSRFINTHPTTKMLALAFLVLIGTMLIAEGFGRHVPKGYIYTAMTFSLFVELLNLRVQKVRSKYPKAAP